MPYEFEFEIVLRAKAGADDLRKATDRRLDCLDPTSSLNRISVQPNWIRPDYVIFLSTEKAEQPPL